MRVKEEAKRGGGLISKGMVVYVGLGMWGRFSGLWLGKEGSGEGERVQWGCLALEGSLLVFQARVGQGLYINTISLFFQTLLDNNKGCCYSVF
jgi:hypothetical protein